MSLDNIIAEAQKEPKKLTERFANLDQLIDAFEEYDKKGEFVSCEFNTFTLDSKMTPDQIYLMVTGETREKFNEEVEKERRKHQMKKEEQIKKAPELAAKYIAEGKELLPEASQEKWQEYVNLNVESLYGDFILKSFLEVAKSLQENLPFEEIRKQIDEQGHSGYSYSILKNTLIELTDNGDKLFEPQELEKDMGDER